MNEKVKYNNYSNSIIVLSLLFNAPVFSEESDKKEKSQTLEVITVTAQKRVESLQETPIAVTAFTADGLEKMQVGNIAEIENFTPNLVFDTSSPIGGSSTSAAVFIRGIGNTDFSLTTDPGVGTYIDGVYVSRSIGGVLDLLDVERIEVLRGPQGTLFGRNSIGGAINITTRKPYDELGGRLDLTLGSFNRTDVRGSIDIPFTDELLSTFAFSSKRRDGFVERPLIGDELGNEDQLAFRGALYYEPNDEWDFQLSFDHSDIDEESAANVAVGFTPGAGTIGWALATYPTLSTDAAIAAGLKDLDKYIIKDDKDVSYGTYNNGSSATVDGASFVANTHQDNFDLKYTAAYRRTKAAFHADADNTPFQITEISNPDYYHKQISHELQFLGTAMDDQIKYIAGVYYFDESGTDNVFVPLHLPTPDLSAGFPAGLNNYADVENSSLAEYLQATWDINDTFSVTAGVRHTLDKKQFDYTQYLAADIQGNPLPFFPGAVDETGTFRPGLSPLVGNGSGSISDKFEQTTFKLGVDATLDDGTLLYYSFSQGFKSGGFVLRYVESVAAPRTFEPETLDAHEIGVKWQSDNERIRINGAVFYSDYQDAQVTFFDKLGGPITANAGEIDIKGLELEITALITDDLILDIGYGYIDAAYNKINPVEGLSLTLDKSAKLVNTPENSLHIGLDYSLYFDESDMAFRVDYAYTDDVFNDSQNSKFLFQEAYDMFNASIRFNLNESIGFVAFVNNLTDKRVIKSGNSNFGLGFHSASYNRPREFGLAIKYTF